MDVQTDTYTDRIEKQIKRGAKCELNDFPSHFSEGGIDNNANGKRVWYQFS